MDIFQIVFDFISHIYTSVSNEYRTS